MKISYDPINLAGAERYMALVDRTADTSSQRKWIEQATAQMFVKNGLQMPEFATLHRGLGFFWGAQEAASSAVFKTEIGNIDLPEHIYVAYWVAADAIP